MLSVAYASRYDHKEIRLTAPRLSLFLMGFSLSLPSCSLCTGSFTCWYDVILVSRLARKKLARVALLHVNTSYASSVNTSSFSSVFKLSTFPGRWEPSTT